MNPFAKKYSLAELDIFRFLNEIPVFSGLSNKEMAEFLPYMYKRTYDQNECVFLRDDPSLAMYLIKNGNIGLSIDIKDSTEDSRHFAIREIIII